MFGDISTTDNSQLANAKQVSFILRNMETVSLLISKDDLKIRFQANSASAMQMVLSETYKRLTSATHQI